MMIFPGAMLVFLSVASLLTTDFRNLRHCARAELSITYKRRYEKLLVRNLQAVSRIVGFFSREYKNFNIDGIFGLQALDGKES